MDLTPYIDSLRRELAVAAEAGGEDARALAERLTAPLESAARLALLDALSAAAGEITRELAPGSVDVRLRGRDPDFVVTPPTGQALEVAGGTSEPSLKGMLASSIGVMMGVLPPATSPDDVEAEEGGTSRVTLRLPEHLKSRVEEAASQAGLSVNAWLVRVVSAALTGGGPRTENQAGTQVGRGYTGWVR